MDNEAVLNPLEQEEAAAAAAAYQNSILRQPIPFAIRNWVLGTSLAVFLILIQIFYQEKKGDLILFTVYRVNMVFMISAFILFLWASVAEKMISSSWKRLFGHVADVLSSFIIGLLTSVLPSSVKVAKYIVYIVCASPTIRLFIIFLVIPLVEFIINKYCCFDNIEDRESGVGGDGDGVGGGDAVGVGEDSEDVGVGVGDDNNNSGAIQMSSLFDSASSVV